MLYSIKCPQRNNPKNSPKISKQNSSVYNQSRGNTIECGFNPKRVCDMIRTYSKNIKSILKHEKASAAMSVNNKCQFHTLTYTLSHCRNRNQINLVFLHKLGVHYGKAQKTPSYWKKQNLQSAKFSNYKYFSIIVQKSSVFYKPYFSRASLFYRRQRFVISKQNFQGVYVQ